jgi:hypothetical protein
MKHIGCTPDQQDGAVTSAAGLILRAAATEVGRLRTSVGPMGGLTLCERSAIEARVARVGAALQDLEDHVRRLRQGGSQFAAGAPGSPSSAPRPA